MAGGSDELKELWLFTRQFPTGSGEVFLETAVPIWAECFSKVRVFHMFSGEGQVALPSGVQVEQPWKDPFATGSTAGMIAELPLLLRILGKSRDGGLPDATALSHARQLAQRFRAMQRIFREDYDPQRVVLLSVWLEDWSTLLAVLKEDDPRVSFKAMAHRTDLFGKDGVPPYQRFQVAAADRVLCIAEDGLSTLAERYPEQREKLELVRLGTVDHGLGPWSSSPELRLVSCSYITPRKRVALIAEALQHVERPVRWTHFGDGTELAAVAAMVQDAPSHVQVDLRGASSNADVLKAYANEPFDAFIHLSEHEGLPVALMEAASFGLPLLATDAGGVKELVGASTGMLWPVDIRAEEVAHFLDSSAMNALLGEHFRCGVRTTWQARFESGAQYRHIAALLLKA